MRIEHQFEIDVHVSDEGSGPEIMSVKFRGHDIIDFLTEKELTDIFNALEEESREDDNYNRWCNI